MNEYNIKVDFTKGMIQTNLKNLVQNDYNSTKLNFTFDKEGRVLFKLLRPDNSQYVDEIVDNTLIFGPGILSKEGEYTYEISLYAEDGRLTALQARTFDVRHEIVNTDEIVEVDDRLPILDNLISEANQINNIDIDIEDSVITLKRKDGTTKVENVKGDKGDKGDAGSIKFIIANELPSEDIDESAIYMIPAGETSEGNTYIEYIYVNGAWESLGSASVNVDMADYPTKEEMNSAILENMGDTYYLEDISYGIATANTYNSAKINNAILPIINKHIVNEKPFTLLIKGNWGELLQITFTISKFTNTFVNQTKTSNGIILNLASNGSDKIYVRQFTLQYGCGSDMNTITSCTLKSTSSTPAHQMATKEYVDSREVTLTQVEYDALTKKDANVYYNIVEE